jgi:hypothetical protein
LIKDGELLRFSIQYYCDKEGFDKEVTTKFGTEEAKCYLSGLPNFANEYQTWYSEAKVLIKQVLSNPLEDFVRHYEKFM